MDIILSKRIRGKNLMINALHLNLYPLQHNTINAVYTLHEVINTA